MNNAGPRPTRCSPSWTPWPRTTSDHPRRGRTRDCARPRGHDHQGPLFSSPIRTHYSLPMVVEQFSPSPVALVVGLGGVSSPPLAGLGYRGLCSLPVLSSQPSLVGALSMLLMSLLGWAVL